MRQETVSDLTSRIVRQQQQPCSSKCSALFRRGASSAMPQRLSAEKIPKTSCVLLFLLFEGGKKKRTVETMACRILTITEVLRKLARAWGPSVLISAHELSKASPMAPVNLLSTPWKRSHNGSDGGSTTKGLNLGASIGIAVGIAFFASALLVVCVYCYCNRNRRRRTRQSPRANAAWDTVKSETPGTGRVAPSSNTRIARVLAIFSPESWKPSGRRQGLPRDDAARLRQLPDSLVTPYMPGKELDQLRKPTAELEGSIFGDGQALHGAEHLRGTTPSPFEPANIQTASQGPVPAYSTGTKLEQDVSAVAHYRSEDTSWPTPRSLDINSLALSMPSTTATPPAAWHRKRTGPPPPLTIAPPVHSRSPSDAYSTYATTRSPYEFYSFNLPPLPSSTSIDAFAPSLPCSAYSLHSSDSTRSSQPLRRPISPQSPLSATSMRSRSDSSAQTSSFPHRQPQSQTQTQRIPSDVTEFVCLGPLPESIPMPSPDQFRTERQQQQKSSPRSPPRAPPSPVFSVGSASPAYSQDPLLHDSDPFRPRHSPASLAFPSASEEEEEERHPWHRLDGDGGGLFSGLERERRPSADSLGSNFTVEEEERIQAQIVKNLEMLGQERVVGGDDIVHIPQISGRRYSWEDK